MCFRRIVASRSHMDRGFEAPFGDGHVNVVQCVHRHLVAHPEDHAFHAWKLRRAKLDEMAVEAKRQFMSQI